MPLRTDFLNEFDQAFRRADETADEHFYDFPRFVTHIDERAVGFVTALYRDFFSARGAILDLMSSWVSHLPEEVDYSRVAALGMNEAELAANPRLSEYVVQNLNRDQTLPFGDAEFGGAAICVSVQYLTEPIKVFRELSRVLKDNAPLIVTFSNRCFPTKAVGIWNALDDDGHLELVREYFARSRSFGETEIRLHQPMGGDPLFGIIGRAQR